MQKSENPGDKGLLKQCLFFVCVNNGLLFKFHIELELVVAFKGSLITSLIKNITNRSSIKLC